MVWVVSAALLHETGSEQISDLTVAQAGVGRERGPVRRVFERARCGRSRVGGPCPCCVMSRGGVEDMLMDRVGPFSLGACGRGLPMTVLVGG